MGILLLVVAILGCAGFYRGMKKNVTLVVDGSAHEVLSFGSTVGDLLVSQGLEIGEHDEVTPSPGAPLNDGMRIDVLVAKEITVLLNGTARTLHVTGRTVDDVLEHINIRSASNAYVRPSRGATIEDGDHIVLREAVRVRVKTQDMNREIITNASDVGFLLTTLGITVGERDRVDPAPATQLRNGLKVTVTRVGFKEVIKREEIPYQTRERHSSSMREGESRVEREGRPGIREKVFRVRKENGKLVKRVLLEERVVRDPQTRVVVVGTRNPNVQEGVASWYGESFRGKRTACGARYNPDALTAAHRTLPCGTTVRVEHGGRSVVVTVNDRGPYDSGRIIDLSRAAFGRLAPLSRGTIHVRLTW